MKPETRVFHPVQGIGIFKGWWLDRPEYARVEYKINDYTGNLLIPRRDLIEIEEEQKS